MYTCPQTHIHRVLSNEEKVYIYIHLYMCKYGYFLIYHSKSGCVFTKEVYTVYIILILMTYCLIMLGLRHSGSAPQGYTSH